MPEGGYHPNTEPPAAEKLGLEASERVLAAVGLVLGHFGLTPASGNMTKVMYKTYTLKSVIFLVLTRVSKITSCKLGQPLTRRLGSADFNRRP